ncbi:MAG: hypothetical protein M1818_008137 [Claussenomyces sp. TS43310]|nr:MAG: hypothetical protein M1818_008137 [Claussenomyces sp. TS43310]
MNSRHLATDEVLVTTTATSDVHDNPPSHDLTAEDNAAQYMNDIAPLDVPETSLDDGAQQSTVNGDQSTAQEMVEMQQPANAVEPAIPQTPPSNGNDDYNMQAPMSLAQMARMDALSAWMSYPDHASAYSTKALSSLAMRLSDEIPLEESLRIADRFLEPLPEPVPEPLPEPPPPVETRISAYAMLEFDDGQFYMNTYSVILGRDLVAARAAMRRDDEAARVLEGAEPKTPVRIKREESCYTKSIMSESGGILREGGDSDSEGRAKRRKHRKASKKSKSTASSSQDGATLLNRPAQPNGRIDYQPQSQVRRHAPDQDTGAKPVDPASLRPSPHDCPLVGIHPPASTSAGAYKAISRRHVKIAYNSKKNLFEAQIIGRNGAFVDDEFYYHKDVVPLKSGSLLQIGGVVVRFVLPDVALGQTGAERPLCEEDNVAARYSEGGKEMSFEFEDTPREGAHLQDTSDEASDQGDDSALRNDGMDVEEFEDGDDGEDEGDEGEEEDVAEMEDLLGDEDAEDAGDEDGEDEDEGDGKEHQATELVQTIAKRKGPGRPPKNGIMSKRELQLAKKEAQAKASQKDNTIPTTAEKNKVGRPRKHPKPDSTLVKTEKRKYTKRKPKDPDAAVKREGSGDEQPSKEKKEKKSTKPPRSPSPVFNEADLTPEQLAKPQANYVTLIHEALSNSETGQMSLPQIYRAIQRKYPFFVLKCNTNGWQSSVRHNLSQHHAFRKVERDGKGWMWAIVDGVSIEKEKKRRPTPPLQLPPQMQPQPIYQAGPLPQHMMSGPPGNMGPPPGYMNGSVPPNIRPGQQPPPYIMPAQPMPGYPMPPPGYAHAVPPQPIGPQASTYSSPYAPKPPPKVMPSPQPSNLGPDNRQAGPQSSGQSVQPQIPQGPPLAPQAPPRPDAAIASAIETFRTVILNRMKASTNDADAIVQSAINRVLGITNQTTVPGNPYEEMIMGGLRTTIASVTNSNAAQSQQGRPPHGNPAPPTAPPPPSQLGNQASMTSSQSQYLGNSSAQTPAPSVPRPFQRPSMGAIPRPGMGRRTSSSSAATSAPRLSAPPSNAPSPAVMSTPSPSPIVNGAIPDQSGSETINSNTSISNVRQGSATAEATTNDHGKRPLSEEAGEDPVERDPKRLNTEGPSP